MRKVLAVLAMSLTLSGCATSHYTSGRDFPSENVASIIKGKTTTTELKALFVKRSTDCATAAAELQTAVKALGGDPENSGSVAGALHRGWVSVKTALSTRDDKSVLEECERGEDAAAGDA